MPEGYSAGLLEAVPDHGCCGDVVAVVGDPDVEPLDLYLKVSALSSATSAATAAGAARNDAVSAKAPITIASERVRISSERRFALKHPSKSSVSGFVP